MKLKRRGGNGEQAQLEALVADMLENGTGGDRSKWKEAFKLLGKNKKLMQKISEIDRNKAFEKYYELGDNRTITDVSKITGYEYIRLCRWRRQYNWEKKIAERDKLVYDVLKAKAVTSVVKLKLGYSNLIGEMIQTMINNINEYNRKVELVNHSAKTPKDMLPYKSLIYDASDFEKLVKLDLLLRGEATERKEISLSDKESMIEDHIANDETTKELLRELYHRTRQMAKVTKRIALPTNGTNGNGSGGNVIDITPSVANQ